MDFHSLARRELQALCKKNKIPANLTNVAMADALQSLDYVDGIEELLNPCESETADSSMESPARSETVTTVPRTGRRATQQKTIKHDLETLQTSTRSRCRTRGAMVRGVDEAKNEVHETPALPTTRRRAAVTSVQAKLESMMKECDPKEKLGDQIDVEKKGVPKTPAAVRTSQRTDVKPKSSARPVYSTRRSARLTRKPMQESSTMENEKSGSIPFDAFPEETDDNLVVDSEQYSVHKNEELDKNGINLTMSESGEINNGPNDVTSHDSNTLVENEIAMGDGVLLEGENNLVVVALDAKAEVDLEEVELGHNKNGSEDVHMSEKKVVDSGKEITPGEKQCLEDVSAAKIEVSGEETMEDSEIDHAAANVDTATVALDVAGEQTLEEPGLDFANANVDSAFEVAHVDANVNSSAVAGVKQPMEELELDLAEVNVDRAADVLEVAGEEEPMEESEVDHVEANMDSAAHGLEVDGEEDPMEEYDVDHVEGNVEIATVAIEVAREEEPMEESEVDHHEANGDSAAHALPPFASVTDLELITQTSCLTPVKSSSETPLKKSSAATNIGLIHVTDDKENIDSCGSNFVLTKEKLKKSKDIAGNDSKQSLQELSLRKLTKMLKELQITKDSSGNEIAKTKAPSSRSALQTLPENRLINETEN